MIPPTSGIENELAEFLTTAYSGLIREYIFFIAAMLIACAVIPVFIVWMFSRHDRRIIQAGSSCKAYTHKKTTPRGIHTAVIVMMPILALRELRCCLRLISRVEIYGAELIVFCVFLLLLAVLAAVGLFRFRIFGLLLTEAFVLCFAALKQYRNLLAAAADMRDRAQYTTIGQYTLYIVDDYIVTQSMAISFVALAALTLLAVYYYKRRFLFMPGKRSLPCCECCGQVISRGDNFCPCCGKWLRLNPIKQEIISLDQKLFCEKCGSVTFLSVCVNCNKGMDFLLKVTQERVNKIKKSLPRDLIFGAVIIVLILLSSGGSARDLQYGSAEVNNAFVTRWKEFYDDPNLAADPEWLAEFDSAAAALYQVDARWRTVKPRSVQSDCLAFFMVYADASFQQMEVLERSVKNVHSAAQGELTADEIGTELVELQAEFDQTIGLQAEAVKYFGSVSAQWDLLGKFGYICFDGLRSLLPWINTISISFIFITGCVLMLMYMLNGFSSTEMTRLEQWLQKARDRADIRNKKYAPALFTEAPTPLLYRVAAAEKSCWFCLIRAANELWLMVLYLIGTAGLIFSLFSPKSIGGCIRWVKAGLTDVKGVRIAPSGTYKRKRKQGHSSPAVVIIAVVMIWLAGILTNGGLTFSGGSSNEQRYLYAAKAAIANYTVDISTIIQDIWSTGGITEKDKARLCSLIDAQIEADQVILAYDMTGLDGYESLHTGLQNLCRDDIEVLQQIKAVIEAGSLPSQELQVNYASLRGKIYLGVIQEAAWELTKLAGKSAFDLS